MPHEISALAPFFFNFGVVVAVVIYASRAPLRKFVYQRHERMRDAFEAAANAHKKAAARAEAASRAMSGLASEERALLQRESANAEQEKKEILDKGQAESQRVLRETDRLASVEQEEASDRVKGEFVNLVIRETEKNLKSNLKKDDHSAILKRAQNSIEVGV